MHSSGSTIGVLRYLRTLNEYLTLYLKKYTAFLVHTNFLPSFGKAFPSISWIFSNTTIERLLVQHPEVFGAKLLKKWVHLSPNSAFLRSPWACLALVVPTSELGMLSGQGRFFFGGVGGVASGKPAVQLPGLSASPHLYEAGPGEPVLSIPPPGAWAWAWSSLRVPALTFRRGARRPGAA